MPTVLSSNTAEIPFTARYFARLFSTSANSPDETMRESFHKRGYIYCYATRSIGQLCSICVLPTLGGSRMICSKRVLPLRMEGFPGTIRLTFHHTARRATRRGPLCAAIGFGISWLLSGYKI